MSKNSPKIEISPSVVAKLRESSGYTEDELAKKLGVPIEKIKKVERGEDKFTSTQIKRLADIYKISLAAFFSEDFHAVPPLPDYRINRAKKLSPEVFIAIRRAEYLSEKIAALSGKRSSIPELDADSPQELAEKLRKYLGLEEGLKVFEKGFKRPNDALEFYKSQLEEKLNLIIIEYPLKSDDVRAFSLFSEIPVIVLNENDEPKVKLFSLLHEVGHLLKKTGGICTADPKDEKEDYVEDIERFCNRFAAEFLIPAWDLRRRFGEKPPSDEDISKLSNLYGVSKQVMMLRLCELNYITWDKYHLEFKKPFKRETPRKRGRRNWERVFQNRVGGVALTEVGRAYKSEEITFSEALSILNMKKKYAEKLLG